MLLCANINGHGLIICIASKGSGAMLLKVGSKRRRTKNEILDEKFIEEQRGEEAKENAVKVLKLRDELDIAKKDNATFHQAAGMLEKLFASGQAKMGEDGQIVMVGNGGGEVFRQVSPSYKQD